MRITEFGESLKDDMMPELVSNGGKRGGGRRRSGKTKSGKY